MGRIDAASQHQQGLEFQEVQQNPAAGDAPPPPDEDLYEPPPDYQPPQAVHAFPPPHEDDVMPPPPPKTTAQAFPPPQEQTAQPFSPTQFNHLHQNQYFSPPPFNPPPAPPLIVKQNMLQLNQPWETHLFDCMANPQNAIVTLCFPCVTFGQIAEVLDNGGTSCATSGILYSLIACCIGMPCLMSCGYRSKLRAKFGLVESPAPDCLIHCFCECCALCQEYRELQLRGFDPAIGHAGNVAKQQQMRLQQLGMTPPMQQRMMI
ncbi:PLAC8 family protein [Perilla frutescens var. hirtella]|uniref:PLAC8 family protein n=1 Tax=Perilla frutescens var. hirtella TaxID=608512 RepID=A0AAD4JQ61_PERFH|nr:PLAC8 family protein [Perilla frutescens var. hirtella]